MSGYHGQRGHRALALTSSLLLLAVVGHWLVGEPARAVDWPSALYPVVAPERHRLGQVDYYYNPAASSAAWVVETLKLPRDDSRAERTPFHVDPNLPVELQIKPDAYLHSGLDRGHLPAADNYTRQADKSATFAMSLMVPQHASANRGVIRQLEQKLLGMRTRNRYLIVATGGLYLGEKLELVDERIPVPSHVAKVALLVERGIPVEMLAWIIPNREPPPGGYKLDELRVKPDRVERLGQVDLFGGLSDELEDRLEAAGPE